MGFDRNDEAIDGLPHYVQQDNAPRRQSWTGGEAVNSFSSGKPAVRAQGSLGYEWRGAYWTLTVMVRVTLVLAATVPISQIPVFGL